IPLALAKLFDPVKIANRQRVGPNGLPLPSVESGLQVNPYAQLTSMEARDAEAKARLDAKRADLNRRAEEEIARRRAAAAIAAPPPADEGPKLIIPSVVTGRKDRR